MRKILTFCLCLIVLSLIASCSDPNEDIFHKPGQGNDQLETVGGQDDGGGHENQPPSGN